MSVARTLALIVAGAAFGFLAVAPVCAQTVAANSAQQASLNVNPSPQDYVAVPTASHAVPPKDPVALAAFRVLETHCARCHESDRLVGRDKPAKGLGNILHMDEMAANTKYVKPGDPNHSTLYWTVFRQEMPYDMNNGDTTLATFPTDAEIKALRDWVVALDKAPSGMVASRTPTTTDWQATKGTGTSPGTDKPVAVPPVVIEAAKPPVPQAPYKVASLAPADETIPLAPKAIDPGPALNGKPSPDLISKTQDRLKAVGCYEGPVNGIEDSQTDAALARYNAKLGRGTAVASLSTDLLEELMSQFGRICTPFCPPGTVADGLQCVPDPGAGQMDRQRPPSAGLGETDEDAPKRHKRRLSTPPADVAHAPEPHRPHQAERTPEARQPRHAERTPEARQPRQAERAPAEPQHRKAERAQPQRKVAHGGDSNLRQPSYRQAPSRSAGPSREASRAPAPASHASSGGAGTMSGMNGI